MTIRDVARRAGVSVATASRALNGKDTVSPETRDRILGVMEELGFSPSPAARRLSLGRTLTIGVVVSFLTRPQAAERLRGVDAVLADSEFDLVIYNVESVQKRDHYLATLAHSQRTDGLLVMSLPPRPETAAALRTAPVPVVFIDVHSAAIAGLPRVARRRRGRWRAGGPPPRRARAPRDRVRRGCRREPVRIHLEPRPPARRDHGAGRAGIRLVSTGWGSGRMDAMRRATWPARCSLARNGPRRSSRRATRRRWAWSRQHESSDSTCPTTSPSSATTISRPRSTWA